MTEQQYKPGDVANGHVLTADGRWVPMGPPSAAPSSPAGGWQSGGYGAAAATQTLTPPVPELDQPRKSRKGRWILLVLLAIVVVIVIASLAGGGESPDGEDGAVGASEGTAGDEEPIADEAQPVAEEPEPVVEVDLATFAAVDGAQWAQIAKDPDASAGQKVIVFAEVTQFDSATGADVFRANVGAMQPSSEYELEDNTVLGGDADLLSDVTAGDVVRVHAEVAGSVEYETTMGGTTTVPSLLVMAIESVGYLDITGDAVLGAPMPQEYGGVDVPLTITNSASVQMSYVVDVVAESPDGATQYGTASAYAENLAPGQSTSTEASFYEDLPGDAVIKVVEVSRHNY